MYIRIYIHIHVYIYRYIYINITCGMDPEGGVSTPASQCLPTEDVPANSKTNSSALEQHSSTWKIVTSGWVPDGAYRAPQSHTAVEQKGNT